MRYHITAPAATPDNPKPYFQYRQPGQAPRRLGQVVSTVTRHAGTESFRFWIVQAAQAESDEERQTALEIGDKIRQRRWPDEE